jgi:ATP-grasp domain-containing protein
MPATLLLAPLFMEDSEALWRAALKAGWTVERVKGWSVPEGLQGADLAYYGSLRAAFAVLLMEALSHVLLEPPPGWLVVIPEEYRRREVHLTTLGDARKIDSPVFLKPAEHKLFPARVYPSGAALPRGEELSDRLPVLVSEPVTWQVEYRCFVVERRVATLSPYWRDRSSVQGERSAWAADPEERSAALSFVRSLLADPAVPLPPAVVLDVGRIEGRGWAAVETNPAWASAIYGCDPGRILPVLRRACIPLAALSPSDTPWVLQSPL